MNFLDKLTEFNTSKDLSIINYIARNLDSDTKKSFTKFYDLSAYVRSIIAKDVLTLAFIGNTIKSYYDETLDLNLTSIGEAVLSIPHFPQSIGTSVLWIELDVYPDTLALIDALNASIEVGSTFITSFNAIDIEEIISYPVYRELEGSIVDKFVPEYLIDQNSEVTSPNEILEGLHPNSVNIVASLLDKLYVELPEFNKWNIYKDYVGEFKLEELFDFNFDSTFYSVSRPELLKGFFKFKGTNIDLQYIIKLSGNSVDIRDLDIVYNDVNLTPFSYGLERDRDCSFITEVEIDLDANRTEIITFKVALENVKKLVISRTMICISYLQAFGNLLTRDILYQNKITDPYRMSYEKNFKSELKTFANIVYPFRFKVNNVTPFKADGRRVEGRWKDIHTPCVGYLEIYPTINPVEQVPMPTIPFEEVQVTVRTASYGRFKVGAQLLDTRNGVVTPALITNTNGELLMQYMLA